MSGPSSVYRNGRCLCKESRTACLHRSKPARHQGCPREISQQRDTEQREADRDVVSQDHDREKDRDFSLKPGEKTEDGARQEWDDEVFQDSMCDTTADDPSHTRHQVLAPLSVEQLDIDTCQPIDLEQDEGVRMGGNKHVKPCLSRADACQVVGDLVKYKTTNEPHEYRLRPRAH